MSFLLGAIARKAVVSSVAKKTVTNPVSQIAPQIAKTSTTFSTVASVAAKGGLGVAVATSTYSGVKSLTGGLSNVAESSLAGVGGALDSLAGGTSGVLSSLGDAVAGGGSSILLLGGVAVVAYLIFMPQKK
jgi:phage-related protein